MRRAAGQGQFHPHTALMGVEDAQVSRFKTEHQVAAPPFGEQAPRARGAADLLIADELEARIGALGERRQVAQQAQHHRATALHIQRAPAIDPPVAHLGNELFGPAHDHIEVTVEQQRGGAGLPQGGDKRRLAV